MLVVMVVVFVFGSVLWMGVENGSFSFDYDEFDFDTDEVCVIILLSIFWSC